MDRNSSSLAALSVSSGSLSARRAWIEIPLRGRRCRYHRVALRKESVDRNICIDILPKLLLLSLSARRAWIEISWSGETTAGTCVALRKESVDRNIRIDKFQSSEVVALRKESVDRNITSGCSPVSDFTSLSARRAWIEIREQFKYVVQCRVALRKESVDRNSENPMIGINKIPSLSARRAWIEMSWL